MVAPFDTNLNSAVQPIGRERFEPATVTERQQPAWFLAAESSSLQEISAEPDPSLAGQTPELIASKILAHIGQ